MTVRIVQGDCREVLRTLADGSVHCCVTSPPYFGLRDYGNAAQIGLEQTPAEYVEQMVAVFREVRRVLRDDGTLWLNLGDSYATTSTYSAPRESAGKYGYIGAPRQPKPAIPSGLKAKDLIGIPWRVAFALQADGWYLRQDIIWHKPNPMPESVRDRCTKAHEYVFLLSKSERYYFDTEAMREPVVSSEKDIARAKILGRGEQSASAAYLGSPQRDKSGGFPVRAARDTFKREASKRAQPIVGQAAGTHRADRPDDTWDTATRNKRSVWTIATQPFSEAHFATMAPDLAETCIRAGCPEGGTVLDPFGGAGTTGLVADRLQRDAVLCELNAEYIEIARRRIASDAPLFANVEAV